MLHLVGQIFDDGLIGFQPPQNEGFHQLFEGGGAAAIVVPLDRQLKLLAKLGLLAQIAGIEEVKDGPEIHQAVFYGGAGEGQPMGGGELQNGFGLGGLGVFDVLGFVEDDAMPGHRLKVGGIPAGQGKGGDD